MSGPRGLHLSGTQVIASVLATLTGAIAASYLGVAGTLIGAALGSIASTLGTEIYRHYLLRSQEGLKSAGEILVHRTTGEHTATQYPATEQTATQPNEATTRGAATQGNGAQTAAGGRHAAQPDLPGQETVTWRRGYPAGAPDPADTQLIPGLAALRRDRQTTRWAGGADRDGQAGPGETASTRASGQVGDRETGSVRPAAGGGPGGGHWWDGISRRQWLAYGGVAAGVFLVVIAAITIFELSAGKPVNAVVWGKHSTGTSVGNLVGGQSSAHKARHPAPTGSPSAQPSSSASQSPAGSVAPSSPAPTTSAPVTPTPTPTTTGTSSPAAGNHSAPPPGSSP
jgi:hypothetical protein